MWIIDEHFFYFYFFCDGKTSEMNEREWMLWLIGRRGVEKRFVLQLGAIKH